MKSGAVIEGFDLVEDGGTSLGEGGEAVMVDQFVFAKQGDWAHGEPTPDRKTGEVPVHSISNSRAHFNYVTYFPGTRSYAWMNTNAGDQFHPQRAYISWHEPHLGAYPHTVWFSTPIPNH